MEARNVSKGGEFKREIVDRFASTRFPYALDFKKDYLIIHCGYRGHACPGCGEGADVFEMVLGLLAGEVNIVATFRFSPVPEAGCEYSGAKELAERGVTIIFTDKEERDNKHRFYNLDGEFPERFADLIAKTEPQLVGVS